MKRQLIGICSALLLSITLTPLCFAQVRATEKPAAQVPAQRQLLSVQFVRIKPGMGAEWREFRKNETLPMLQKAGTKDQRLWSSAIFGEGSYLITTPIESLAQYDSPGTARRVLGEEGAAAYNAKLSRFIESSRTIAIETRPDMSIQPGDQPKLMVVTLSTIEEGYTADYESFVKTKVLPMIKKAAPKGYRVSRVVYGGNLNLYRSAALFDSFEELGKYREALAKEMAAAKFSSKGVGIVSRENAIYRFVPELSIVPTPVKVASK